MRLMKLFKRFMPDSGLFIRSTKNVVFCILLIFIGGCGLFQKEQLPKKRKQTGNFWKITLEGNSKASFIQGTIHPLCSDKLAYKSYFTSLSDIDRVLVDNKKTKSAIISEMINSATMDGKTLESLFKSGQIKKVKEFLSEYGLNWNNLKNRPPIIINEMLIPKISDCENKKTYYAAILEETGKNFKQPGNTTETKKDTSQSKIRVMDNDQKRWSLEDYQKNVDAQKIKITEVFKESIIRKKYSQELSYEKQADYLWWTISNTDSVKIAVNKMNSYYDVPDYISAAKAKLNAYPYLKDYHREFIQKRNQAWARKIRKYSREGSVFALVNVEHLTGPEGILNLLKEKGFEVERIN